MADEIVFYTNPQSRGAMTHWMLEEIGCRYRLDTLHFTVPESARTALVDAKRDARQMKLL